jgi:hypothetical protein
VHAEEIDGEVPLNSGAVAQSIVKVDAGVVDEQVQRCYLLDRVQNLFCAGNVERHRRDSGIRIQQCSAARTREDPPHAPPKHLMDERVTKTAVRAGDEDRFVLDVHTVRLSGEFALDQRHQQRSAGQHVVIRITAEFHLTTFRAAWPQHRRFTANHELLASH